MPSDNTSVKKAHLLVKELIEKRTGISESLDGSIYDTIENIFQIDRVWSRGHHAQHVPISEVYDVLNNAKMIYLKYNFKPRPDGIYHEVSDSDDFCSDETDEIKVADQLVEELDLSNKKNSDIKDLSGGELQRLAIIASI